MEKKWKRVEFLANMSKEDIECINKYFFHLMKDSMEIECTGLNISDTTTTMRTIKFTAGLTDEYEIIRTNADDDTIEAQLKEDSLYRNNPDPYNIIEGRGFTVEIVGCQYDDEDLKNIVIDKKFDAYDYEY